MSINNSKAGIESFLAIGMPMAPYKHKENNMKIQEVEKNKGTYAGVKFSDDTVNALIAYCRDNKIANALGAKDFHSTLLYSRKHLPDYEPQGELTEPYTGTPKEFDVWPSPPNAFKEKETNCLILTYDCKELVNRFDFLMDEHDATFDYDEYTPHVTLSYDAGDLDVSTLPEFTGQIVIASEYEEELDLDKTFNGDDNED